MVLHLANASQLCTLFYPLSSLFFPAALEHWLKVEDVPMYLCLMRSGL